MRTAPSILLLDDGELERSKAVLASLGADFVHLKRPEIENAVALPRDLLVTSLKLAQEVPAFEHPAGETLYPKWVCVADQDFRPLREQLRDLGVHYLVDARRDAESMRLFFLQLVLGFEAIAITKVDEPLPSEPVEEGESGRASSSGETRSGPPAFDLRIACMFASWDANKCWHFRLPKQFSCPVGHLATRRVTRTNR